jgi:hypothetical protein
VEEQAGPDRVVDGRYRLIGEVGSGGFGRVWRAFDENLKVDVALKEMLLPPSTAESVRTELKERARREACNAAQLRGAPGIVTVYDFCLDEDTPWLVMDLVPGVALDTNVTQSGPLPVESAAMVADVLLSALGAAHERGIIHRDVKPANVLIASAEKIVLTDFGIAAYRDDTRLTATTTIVGSLEYTSPERLNGNEATPASDLFAVGATLFYAVEGISPFRRNDTNSTITAIMRHDLPPMQRAGVLTDLITRLLEFDPAKRPSVAEARQLVADARQGITIPRPAKPVTRLFQRPVWSPPRPSRWRNWKFWVAVLLLYIVVIQGLRGAFSFGDLWHLIGGRWGIDHAASPTTQTTGQKFDEGFVIMAAIAGPIWALTLAIMTGISVNKVVGKAVGGTTGAVAGTASLAATAAILTLCVLTGAGSLLPGLPLSAALWISLVVSTVLVAIARGLYREMLIAQRKARR